MDFGMKTLETAALMSDFGQKSNNNKKIHGSGFLNQIRSDPNRQDDQAPFLRTSKAARTDPIPIGSDSMLPIPATAASSNNMLSFSSSSSINVTENGNQSSLLSSCQPPLAYIENAGYVSERLQASMHVPVSRCKGLFTPSQWIELEHQVLTYKYFVANVPIPPHLLDPIRKSLHPFHCSGLSSSFHGPNAYGLGGFHLELLGKTDPEPWRCRRTDGKKWRCSKDAVPDKKYCERHINRGRHRSRKLVEGKNGHGVAGFTLFSKMDTTVSSSAINLPTKNLINRSQDSQKASFYGKNGSSYQDQEPDNQNPLRQFIDNKPQELKTERTQLSMSKASQDFSSSSNSEKLTIAQKQASNLLPSSWQNSMGGPLGEVLKTSRRNEGNSKTEMWDDVNHHSCCSNSPTGVVHKTTLISLSKSSSKSSPKGNNKEDGNGGSGCDEVHLSVHANSISFPSFM